MHKSLKGGSAVFYKPVGVTTEIKSGFLLKSPPPKQFKTEKSWKRRYFVLYKIGEQGHQLKYCKSPEEKDKVNGEIDLLHISRMCVSPQDNSRWSWIQKTFKCSASCVLCIRAADRDFFLIGGDSSEIEGWFDVLFDALKTRPHNIAPAECMRSSQSGMVISKPINAYHTCAINEIEDFSKRRASEPVNSEYDYPKSYFSRIQTASNGTARCCSLNEIYEPMMELNRFEERDEKRPLSEFSSGSSDNGAVSSEEMLERPPMLDKESSTESLDDVNPEERDITVKQADMKKHLTVTEVDGRPTISGWTGQPQTECLFHKGDQVLAINDLHTGTVDEFNMYLSRTLKNEVKVTILRQHGCQPLHLPSCLCSG
ncbi:pleckstrin homology domain-containing family S member 1-like isoform X2 [Nelusetta ayraudi]|uniref:pleckstrin homology domain-containing family S member 1-like isoform X2 n=1 Tax=Nelusetta ayraudi TaxID=303726 RepID=UPI003F71F593